MLRCPESDHLSSLPGRSQQRALGVRVSAVCLFPLEPEETAPSQRRRSHRQRREAARDDPQLHSRWPVSHPRKSTTVNMISRMLNVHRASSSRCTPRALTRGANRPRGVEIPSQLLRSAQLYIECGNLQVTGGGSKSPATVSIPGGAPWHVVLTCIILQLASSQRTKAPTLACAFKPLPWYPGALKDIASTYNLYSGQTTYTIPGPGTFAKFTETVSCLCSPTAPFTC